jgi:hypothetical protein
MEDLFATRSNYLLNSKWYLTIIRRRQTQSRRQTFYIFQSCYLKQGRTGHTKWLFCIFCLFVFAYVFLFLYLFDLLNANQNDRWSNNPSFSVKCQTTCNSNATLVVAMRHWSQGPLQSPIQMSKKGPFVEVLGAFWIFCVDGRRGLLIKNQWLSGWLKIMPFNNQIFLRIIKKKARQHINFLSEITKIYSINYFK